MTKQTFVPTQLGLTSFMESNRMDFCLEGPEKTKTRCTVFYDNLREDKKLDGKLFRYIGVVRNNDGAPTAIEVQWGRKHLKLGRRTKAAGSVSFYKSLEPSNKVAGPKSDDEILSALGEGI